MGNRFLFILLSSISALMSCNTYHLNDLTKEAPPIDLTRASEKEMDIDSLLKSDVHYYYKRHQNLLNKLQLDNLKSYPRDTSAFRIITDRSWPWHTPWAGEPLAITLFKRSDSCIVEGVEIRRNEIDKRSDHFYNPVKSTFTYRTELKNFQLLESYFSDEGYWTSISFPKSTLGTDENIIFLEMRTGNKYKFMVFQENLPELDFWILLIKFLETSGYNDAFLNEIKLEILSGT